MKRMTVLGASILACGAALLSGCENHANLLAEKAMMGGNVQYSPDGELYRWYEYYPEEKIFRSVYHYTWYWQEEQSWKFGESLPDHMRVSNDSVIVQLPTGRPYTMFRTVAAEYPSTEEALEMAAAFDSEMLYEAVAGVDE